MGKIDPIPEGVAIRYVNMRELTEILVSENFITEEQLKQAQAECEMTALALEKVLVEFKRVSNLNRTRAALKALSEGVEITFLDNKGIW